MHVNLERRNGADRRSSAAARGQEQRWNEAALADLVDVGDEPYDPYDPYWEPVKGQDDD